MNDQKIRQLAQQLRKVADKATDIPGNKSRNFQVHDGVQYSLSDESSILFNETVEKILKQKDFERKFSASYISVKLKSIFAKLISESQFDLENELTLLLHKLTGFKEKRIVYLKIEGIILSVCFQLGRVRFVPGDKYLLENMKNKVSIITASLKHTEEEKDYFNRKNSQDFECEFSGGCVGIVEVIAEPGRAYEIGKEEIRRAIDLLRFSSKALYPLKESIRIGLKGDHPETKRLGLIISGNHFSIKDESNGSVFRFEINHDSLERMNEIGVFKISEALRRKQANNFEEYLIRSIHWFSVALTQERVS